MISIRWKIILLCIVVLLLPILALNYYSVHTFDRFASRDLEEHMIDSAFFVGEQWKFEISSAGSNSPAVSAQFVDVLRRSAREVGARIQLLSSAGQVLVDSDTNAVLHSDLSSLPEVAMALQGRYKARAALTSDRKYMFYFIAYPVWKEGRVCAVAYLSRHTSPIVTTINQMIRFQRMITLAAILGGILLAGILAYSITSRLRAVTLAARAFARGEASLPLRVRGRDEVAGLTHAINQMAGEIQRTNQYNREFVSTVMHELRMPITAIKGAAELLEQGAYAREEARSKFLGNIRFEVDRLARMVWELNELAKLDMEVPHAQKERVEYGSCVEAMVDRIRATLDEPHAEIHVQRPEKPVYARILTGRIEQVVGNLIQNAVRYTPADGTIGIKVSAMPDGTVQTWVHDTGCGISPANLSKVFDRFFTTEPKGQRREYGSGLGLAIAKSIIESHQGRIWVESVPGEGATFCFILPSCE